MPLILTDSCIRVTASECLAVGVCLQLSKRFTYFLGLKPCLWYRRERFDVVKKKNKVSNHRSETSLSFSLMCLGEFGIKVGGEL